MIFLPKVLQKYRRFIFDEKIFFFTGHKHMWSVPNAFIVNISISDFLMTVFNCIFNYIYMRDRDWIFSDAYCVFNNFIAICTVAASVFSLSAMSINRYVHYMLRFSTLFLNTIDTFKKASSSFLFFKVFFRNVIHSTSNKKSYPIITYKVFAIFCFLFLSKTLGKI